jgi:thiamine pyrophosphokinase
MEVQVRAIIIVGGQTEESEAWRSWMKGGALVIGANGGAASSLEWGLEPHVVIGDMDSLSLSAREHLVQKGVELEELPRDKDETDLELALLYALKAGADEIVILGALGGRLDHTLSNILLMTVPARLGVPTRIVEGQQQAMILLGGQSIEVGGEPGDLVSLLPLGGDASGVITEGLVWQLNGETLKFGYSRGVSNKLMGTNAKIEVGEGCLLVVQGPSENGQD